MTVKTYIRHRCEIPSCKKVLINVYVTGAHAIVKAPDHYPLRWIIPGALQQTGYAGWPPDNFQLRDEAGNLLNIDVLIKEWNFSKRTKLFLNLLTGVGA